MPSRYYPAVKAPNVLVHGGAQGTWAKQSVFGRSWSPVQWTWRLSASKSDAGTQTTRIIQTNQQGDHDLLLARWMTPPLDAQSLGGTLQIAFGVQARWDDPALGFTNDSLVRFKIHAYLANGQSHVVRTVLVSNHVDSVNFPGTTGQVWRSLAVAQSLAAATAVAGDVIVVEIGMRIVSSPTPTPQYFPTDTGATRIDWRATGASAAFVDAVAGDTSTSRAPWIEFSSTLTEQAASPPPANDACADAIVIPATLPYVSAFIDTTGSTDTERGVWWTWTAPTSGKVCFHTFGANYGTILNAFTGGCGVLTPVGLVVTETDLAQHRSQSSIMFSAVAGTQYWIRVRNSASAENASSSGGLVRLSAFYRVTTPVVDDLYLPAGYLVQIRDGAIVNFSAGFTSDAPTGVAIDYTKRTIDDLNGGTHSGERILLALHDFELVELLDLPTLSYGDFQFEVDFIGDPWFVATISIHPAQIYITAAGFLYVGWFGNGYLYIVGLGTGLPSILNTVSNDANFSALKSIDATSGDSQPGAPFTDALQFPTIEVCAPWAITLDEATGILYYTSGGFYEPVGGTQIRRFNVNTSTQLANFATLALQAGNNPGLKGLQFLPDGSLLVCNSTIVQRLDANGVVIQTFTPSIPDDSQSLCDVKLTADGTGFWVVDEPTTRLFRFSLVSGLETLTVQPYLRPGTLVQMAIYQPSGALPPASSLPEGCPPPEFLAAVTPPPGCPPVLE